MLWKFYIKHILFHLIKTVVDMIQYDLMCGLIHNLMRIFLLLYICATKYIIIYYHLYFVFVFITDFKL